MDDDDAYSQENHDDSGIAITDRVSEYQEHRKHSVGGMLAWDQILHRSDALKM